MDYRRKSVPPKSPKSATADNAIKFLAAPQRGLSFSVPPSLCLCVSVVKFLNPLRFSLPAILNATALPLLLQACTPTPPPSHFAEAIATLEQYQALKQKIPQAWATGDIATAQSFDTRGPQLAQTAKDLFDANNIHAARDPKILEAHADTLVALGDHDLAAKAYQRLLHDQQDNPRLWEKLGTSLAQIGQSTRPEAVTALRKSLDLDPASPQAADTWYTLGDLYHRASRYEFANEAYTQALDIAPQHLLAHLGAAALKTRDGNVAGASQEINALGPAARQHDALIRVLLRKALDDFDHFRQSFPDTPENHLAYAKLLYRASRPTDAIFAAKRVTKLNPQDDKTWYFLGQMQAQIGNNPQAIQAYEKSLAANPNQPQLKQALQQFKQQATQQQTPPQ